MKTRWLALIGIVALTAVLWLSMPRGPEPLVIPVAARSPNPAPTGNVSTPVGTAKHEEITPNSPPPTAPPTAVPVKVQRPVAAVAAQIASAPEPPPGLAPMVVMQNMRSTIRQYGARFGGNPVGNNAEITARLSGRNPGHVNFLGSSDDGLCVNDRGELIDNWGTPFFFHQISGTEMEIRSAGPDKKMWTADDLVMQ